jgi:hypothetical protein
VKKLFLITFSLIGLLFLFEEPSFSASAEEQRPTPTNLFRIVYGQDHKELYVVGTMHSLTFESLALISQKKIRTVCNKGNVYTEQTLSEIKSAPSLDGMALNIQKSGKKVEPHESDLKKDSLTEEDILNWKKLYNDKVLPRFLECQLLRGHEEYPEIQSTLKKNVLHPLFCHSIILYDEPDYHKPPAEAMDVSIANLVDSTRNFGLETSDEAAAVESPEENLKNASLFKRTMSELEIIFDSKENEPWTDEGIDLFRRDCRENALERFLFSSYNPFFLYRRKDQEETGSIDDIKGRNELWFPRIQEALKEASLPLLIAVGFGHLGGESGVLNHFLKEHNATIFQLVDDGSEEGTEKEIHPPTPNSSFKALNPHTPQEVIDSIKETYGDTIFEDFSNLQIT